MDASMRTSLSRTNAADEDALCGGVMAKANWHDVRCCTLGGTLGEKYLSWKSEVLQGTRLA